MFGIINPKESENTFIFQGSINGSTADVFRCWQKPLGIRFVHIIAIGGGGAGGGGHSTTAAAGTGCGGGGGGSGGISSVLIPSALLPDALYIKLAYSALPNNNGETTYVCLYPSINYPLVAAGGGSAGTSGTNTVVGAGGAGAVAKTISDMKLATMGHYFFIAGSAGVAGGSQGEVGTSITLYSSTILSGGAGGGGSSAFNSGGDGGIVSYTGSSYNIPSLQGGLSDGSTISAQDTYADGQKGFRSFKPLAFSGGSGGGANAGNSDSSILRAGGKGGAGEFGCGGGGGGCGHQFGSGGIGGPGMVIISCF